MEMTFPSHRDLLRDGVFVFKLNDNGQGPQLLRQVFIERGWVEFDEDEQSENDWNLYWRTSRFRASDYDVILPWQRLNHFPKSVSITKKDSLARNLKRMRGIFGRGVFNFSPLSFNLPNDYTKFVAEYTRLRQVEDAKSILWICKPADQSRGRGIFLFRELSDLQYDCSAVVQRYISNPMLIGGYKFDLRIYVLVPCFHPLTIYIYQEGLVRFSTEKFNLESLNNIFSHLTNTSINKHSPEYTTDKERVGSGCKWTLTQLRYYFHQNNIDDRMLFARISNIVVLTLIMQAPQCPKINNCFELYGFDIMVDENLKPWLLEVNFSPALSIDCQVDSMVKKPLIHDLLDMMKLKDSDRHRGQSNDNGSVQSKHPSNKRRQSLVSRQKDASMRHFNRLQHNQVLHSNTISESYYYKHDSADNGWASDIQDKTIGGGLPIVKNRDDIKRECSNSSGFSSASSAGNEAQRSQSSLGLTFSSKASLESPLAAIPRVDSKPSVLSDSAISSGSERSASGRSNTSEKKSTILRKETLSYKAPKPCLSPVNSIRTSVSSPALHKISAQWSNSQQNLNDLKFVNQDLFVPNRSGGSGHVNRKVKPKTVPPSLKRSGSIPVLSSGVPKDCNNNALSALSSQNVKPNSTIKCVKHSKPPARNSPPYQIGDYYLVFPLSDGMVKSCKPVLDVRSAVQESQKQLKRSLVEIRNGGSQQCKPVHHGIVLSNDQLWGPVRLPEAED